MNRTIESSPKVRGMSHFGLVVKHQALSLEVLSSVPGNDKSFYTGIFMGEGEEIKEKS